MASPARSDPDTSSRLRSSWSALWQLDESPTRVAAALALGVFFSFTPFIGAQILLSMALAVLLRLSKVAVFIGLNANLPWIMLPWYGGTTLAAAMLLGWPNPFEAEQQVVAAIGDATGPIDAIKRLGDLVAPALWPLVIGSTIGAALLGLATFVVVRWVLVRRASALGR